MFLLRKPSVLFAFLEMRVMAAIMSEQLKSTIAEHVSISVKSVANSVADIITGSLNDRMTALETEDKTLKEQINKLKVKVQELEAHKRQTDQCIDTADQYSRRPCLRISGIPESYDECTYDAVLNIARAVLLTWICLLLTLTDLIGFVQGDHRQQATR